MYFSTVSEACNVLYLSSGDYLSLFIFFCGQLIVQKKHLFRNLIFSGKNVVQKVLTSIKLPNLSNHRDNIQCGEKLEKYTRRRNIFDRQKRGKFI